MAGHLRLRTSGFAFPALLLIGGTHNTTIPRGVPTPQHDRATADINARRGATEITTIDGHAFTPLGVMLLGDSLAWNEGAIDSGNGLAGSAGSPRAPDAQAGGVNGGRSRRGVGCTSAMPRLPFARPHLREHAMSPFRSLPRTLAIGTVLGLLLAPAAGAQAAPAAPDTTARVVDRLFQSYADTHSPGCALAISRNGQLLYERGYGMANLETGTPNTPASIFHMASVSKQFTAMAIQLLARDGKLSLDDDIRTYFPEIPDYGTTITIRHLLHHTSGLRDQWNLLALARGRFEENRITTADVLDIVPRQKALNFTPGAEYLYSNTGYTLAAVIVQKVSGQSLRAFAQERIFNPLGMTRTHFHDDYTMLVPGRTSAYAPIPGGWRVSIPNFDTYGATSLYSTVGDLLLWQANFDRFLVGDRALLAEMEAPTRLTSGEVSTYGLGLSVASFRGTREVGHSGADAGYRSFTARYPEHGLAVAVACNAAPSNPTALGRGAVAAYLGDALRPVPAPPPTPQPVAVSTEGLQRLAGAYLQTTTLQGMAVTWRGGNLVLGVESGPALIPVAENRFRVTGQPVELVFDPAPGTGVEQRPLGGGPTTRFERQPEANTSGAALAEFAGEYFSEELNATYRATFANGSLTFRTGTSNPMPARPAFRDAFLVGGDLYQFTRNGGRITGYTVSNGRVRRVAFARVPPRR